MNRNETATPYDTSSSTEPISLLVIATILGWAMQGHMVSAAQPLEIESGTGCYTYGDDQTPALAKRAALTLV